MNADSATIDIQTTFSMTPALARRGYAASIRSTRVFLWCAGAAFIALSVILHAYYLIPIGVAYLGIPYAIVRLKTWRWRSATTVVVHLTDVDLQWTEPNVASRVAWSHARSVQRRSGSWIVKFPGVRTPLPIQAFQPADIGEIEAFFHARGLMGPAGGALTRAPRPA